MTMATQAMMAQIHVSPVGSFLSAVGSPPACLFCSLRIGPVHSVKVLRNKGCAFVNYIRKEDSEQAIQRLHVSLL